MKITSRTHKILMVILAAILAVTVLLLVYTGSVPEKYRLSAGDASPYDITAPRSVRDKAETDLRAAKAAAEVPDVMLRSDQISEEVKSRIDLFFGIISGLRANPPQPTPLPTEPTTAETTTGETQASETQATETEPTVPAIPGVTEYPEFLAEKIILRLNTQLQIILSQDDALKYATLEDQRFESIKGHTQSLANLIMAGTVDTSGLKNALADRIDELKKSMNFYQEDSGLVERALGLILKPNVVFDQVATENARKAAFDKVQNNPVMIDKGTRIVSVGDIITDETYRLLQDLSIIDNGSFDYAFFAGIILLISLLVLIVAFYIRHYEKENIRTFSDYAALALSMMIPLVLSVYLARQSSLTPPVYFAAVLISAYFGFRAATILSICLIAAIMPMTSFDPIFLIVALCGCLTAALFTRGIIRKDNYAFIIIATAGTNFIVTFSAGLLQKSNWSDIMLSSGFTVLSGTLSVIAAIGIMPLFEMLFNSVSPLRLIELSQPGHPLLRRLFVEAPGSSQHSMMVANLADAAAVAIGANALLARVGSYYHDIGKLETPLMFTENQEGENPHDSMVPEKSAEVILSHPDAGVRIGKRYRLPIPILKIIHEHHGSTAQIYFYNKAKKSAENGARPEPDLSQFKYRCPVPSTRESAIVMLADSVEAAMKSTGTSKLEDAEVLIRKIIKIKNEQDQLIASGLSYHDVEVLVQAFLQVYTGHFHERVSYPDERSIRQPSN